MRLCRHALECAVVGSGPWLCTRCAVRGVLPLQVVGQGAAPGEGGDDWALTSVVLALIRVNNNKMEESE